MDYTELNDRMNKASVLLTYLQGKLLSEICPIDESGIITPKMMWKINHIEQLSLYRAVDEVESILNNWNISRLLSCTLLARSLIENTSQYVMMVDICKKFIDMHIDISELDDILMRLNYGNKFKDDNSPSHSDPYNVLKVIDYADNVYFKKEKYIRETYESLCEFAHPNWNGKENMYSKLIDNKYLIWQYSNHIGWEKSAPFYVCSTAETMLNIIIETTMKLESLKVQLWNRFIELKLDFNS